MDNAEKVLAGTRTSKRHYVLVLLAALVFGGLFYTGYKPWQARQNRLFASSDKASEKIIVSTVRAVRGAETSELVFTGALFAATETTVYARAEGYIKLRAVDLGDRVKAGQLLAEIDTPELTNNCAKRATATINSKRKAAPHKLPLGSHRPI